MKNASCGMTGTHLQYQIFCEPLQLLIFCCNATNLPLVPRQPKQNKIIKREWQKQNHSVTEIKRSFKCLMH